jgi:hypothetical protein
MNRIIHSIFFLIAFKPGSSLSELFDSWMPRSAWSRIQIILPMQWSRASVMHEKTSPLERVLKRSWATWLVSTAEGVVNGNSRMSFFSNLISNIYQVSLIKQHTSQLIIKYSISDIAASWSRESKSICPWCILSHAAISICIVNRRSVIGSNWSTGKMALWRSSRLSGLGNISLIAFRSLVLESYLTCVHTGKESKILF